MRPDCGCSSWLASCPGFRLLPAASADGFPPWPLPFPFPPLLGVAVPPGVLPGGVAALPPLAGFAGGSGDAKARERECGISCRDDAIPVLGAGLPSCRDDAIPVLGAGLPSCRDDAVPILGAGLAGEGDPIPDLLSSALTTTRFISGMRPVLPLGLPPCCIA
jgi:hypothetical protein